MKSGRSVSLKGPSCCHVRNPGAKRSRRAAHATMAINPKTSDPAASEAHALATELTNEVLKKNLSDNDSLARRAVIELNHSDPAGAIGDLRALLRDRPQSVPAQRMIARAYAMNGQPGLAEQALRAAMDVAQGKISMRSNDEALNHLRNEISRILEPERWVGR